MIYKAKTQTFLMQFLLALGLVRIISTKSITGLDIILMIGILVVSRSRYKFQINEKSLSYQMLLLSIPLYKKEIVPEQIAEIKFIRVGWTKKGAVVRIKRGLNIRVIHFNSDSICEDLEHFAHENNVSVRKTRDYKVLER